MKRVVFLVAVVLGLGLQSQAQEVLGGIKVDAMMSNFILNDLDGMKSKLGFGASVGGYTKIEFNNHFALQPELYEFQILASYKIGFINALNANKDDASMLNQTISLGLGYRF